MEREHYSFILYKSPLVLFSPACLSFPLSLMSCSTANERTREDELIYFTTSQLL